MIRRALEATTADDLKRRGSPTWLAGRKGEWGSRTGLVNVETRHHAPTDEAPMTLAIHAASAQMGGAMTYLRNILPLMAGSAASQNASRILLWAQHELQSVVDSPAIDRRDPGGASDTSTPLGIGRRIWFDQSSLPKQLRAERVDVLFSSANFGVLRCPVPQVLLVCNTIYFEPRFTERMRSPLLRLRTMAERQLVIASIRAADVVLFPSRAMMDLTAVATGGPRPTWHVAPFGAQPGLFSPRCGPRSFSSPTRVLHVSHYSEQKNIGTLLRAMTSLEQRSRGRYFLQLTAGMAERRPGARLPSLSEDVALYRQLERRGAALDLGQRSYGALPDLYRSADVFVFPSYTESFGFPLVEAMSSGVPIVAADVPIHREMCGEAAVYFPAFDAEACARAIERVANDAELSAQMRDRGLRRAGEFTWSRHVESLWDAVREARSS
ncbi:MAG: glycosyltransferase family 1 protein [Polyangiaceae bacterium]